MYSPEYRVAFAALTAAVSLLERLAQRGLIEPGDVDVVHTSITETLENAYGTENPVPDGLSAGIARHLDPVFAQIREVAAKRRP